MLTAKTWRRKNLRKKRPTLISCQTMPLARRLGKRGCDETSILAAGAVSKAADVCLVDGVQE